MIKNFNKNPGKEFSGQKVAIPSRMPPNGHNKAWKTIGAISVVVAVSIGGGWGIDTFKTEQFEKEIASMVGVSVLDLNQSIKHGKATYRLEDGTLMTILSLDRENGFGPHAILIKDGNTVGLAHFEFPIEAQGKYGGAMNSPHDIRIINLLAVVETNIPNDTDALNRANNMLQDPKMKNFWKENVEDIDKERLIELAHDYLLPGMQFDIGSLSDKQIQDKILNTHVPIHTSCLDFIDKERLCDNSKPINFSLKNLMRDGLKPYKASRDSLLLAILIFLIKYSRMHPSSQ